MPKFPPGSRAKAPSKTKTPPRQQRPKAPAIFVDSDSELGESKAHDVEKTEGEQVAVSRDKKGDEQSIRKSDKSKRKRKLEDRNSKNNAARERIRLWLIDIAGGKETLLRYQDAIETEFDNSLEQIAACYGHRSEDDSLLDAIAPEFWDALEVRPYGHKFLFAKAIEQLQREVCSATA